MMIDLYLLPVSIFDTLGETAASLALASRRKKTGAEPAGQVEILAGPEALSVLEADWRALEGEPSVSPFQSLAMARAAAAAHQAHGQEPMVVTVRGGGESLVILPLVMTAMGPFRVLRFLGDPLIQYGDALCSPRAGDAHLAQALAAVRTLGADVAFLRKVRGDARIAPLLAAAGRSCGADAAPYADLAAALPAESREVRRCRRRLTEQGEMREVYSRGREALGGLAQALAWKRDWLKARNLSSLVIGDEAWEAALTALASEPHSPLACLELRVGPQVAAIEIAVTGNGRWCVYLGAINTDFARWGPGSVQMADSMAHARDQGFDVYDLMAPAAPFKQALASGETPIDDYALPLSLKGRLAAGLLAQSRPLKAAAARLPQPLLDRAARLLFRLK